jgi:hypothetical protein
MFDNYGSDKDGGPSRLLMVDLASGLEKTIFPIKSTPKGLRNLFSDTAGKIDISPDRQRAIVTFTGVGKAVEVSIPEGEVLNIFTSLHDSSQLEELSDERNTKAARYPVYGVDYVNRHILGDVQ